MGVSSPMTPEQKAAANQASADNAAAAAQDAREAAAAEMVRIASLPVLSGETVLSGVRNNGEFQVPGNPGVTVKAELVNGQKSLAYVGAAKVTLDMTRIGSEVLSLLTMFLEGEQTRMEKGHLKTVASVGLLFIWSHDETKDANHLPYPVKGGQEMAVLNRESNKAAADGYNGAFHLLRKDPVTGELYCYLTKSFRAKAQKEIKSLKPVTVAAEVIEGEFTAKAGTNGTG